MPIGKRNARWMIITLTAERCRDDQPAVDAEPDEREVDQAPRPVLARAGEPCEGTAAEHGRAVVSEGIRSMRTEAFARLAAMVATAFLAPGALAYGPTDGAIEAPVQATGDPAMRTTTGGKGALPTRTRPVPVADPSPIEMMDEEDADGVAATIDVPFEGRAHLADIRDGEDGLPVAVAARRRRLMDAAASGDIEALRAVFGDQAGPPTVAALEQADDAVELLRGQSGDPEGREILAILLELFEAGYVAVEDGAETTYVWPYFAEVPLTELPPQRMVELYRVLTAVDVEDMMREGRYMFFRLGISEDGRLRYFLSGDIE